ncbi:MAG: hypothetical protein HYU66_24030, partial [Armatimonadetes bacterium]|nr:hypothetical protein [Armatimonadota bacterium]
GAYGKVFGDGVLKRWVSVGGTAVALGGSAATHLAEQELTSARRVSDLRRAHDEPKPPDKDAPPVPAEHRPRGFAGVTLWTELDPYSFLTYGCPSRLRVPYNTDALFRPSIEGYNVATFPAAGELLVAGFAPDGMEAALRGQVYLWQEHVGAGQVVCFADAPTFRASWPMLDRLWLNAALFGVAQRRE